MDKETIEVFENAKGKIELDINGMDVQTKLKINNAVVIYLALKSLITALAKLTNNSEPEVVAGLLDFIVNSKSFVADSQEQADVIKEILKHGGTE